MGILTLVYNICYFEVWHCSQARELLFTLVGGLVVEILTLTAVRAGLRLQADLMPVVPEAIGAPGLELELDPQMAVLEENIGVLEHGQV